jgi:hypothetical protein
LHCALAFHEEFMKSGDMHNVDWAQYQRWLLIGAEK